MVSSSSGFVAALTVAAVATVGVLAYQASATAPASFGGRPHAGAAPSVSVSAAPRARRDPKALPVGSGRGERVVYAVGTDRVWLVEADGRVRRTFEVLPGDVDPRPGTYAVTSRSNAVTGSDGRPIQHVVRFTAVDGVTIGFSTAVGEPTGAPDPDAKTGGIRESRADGEAMWQFATIGETVVVVR
ncbi:hypothetical protein [Streptomyces mangrovisoli]|uniref:L,D-transpeptidase n=1 Tax=Streptomyces mangrovisoli TaxID=1428628 RepID=A0A1J4P268_9ACTN|nr:hypothetical protein [Streptomyces mangrovisoli]OIJ67573.1 hypothetical protein WN71_012875 [Streptomyces mangrovisoli]